VLRNASIVEAKVICANWQKCQSCRSNPASAAERCGVSKQRRLLLLLKARLHFDNSILIAPMSQMYRCINSAAGHKPTMTA
jgi:hypothetical protein